ncbi:MAG: UDP-N-acetylmuramate--L-alanine ligase, partial [Solirubrobacteraceae bacterium]
LGADVTGSDRAPSSYTARLVANGIEPSFGHARENVPGGAEVVYSSAIGADNPERGVAGRELHRADLLAEIASLRRCLAVTGTHGKTTTAAMAVHALAGAGLDPSYVVGGELRCTGSNAGWGSGDWIVVEADESDRSLLKLDPEIAVLTNAELDHHATYTSLLDLERTLAEFMARAGAQHAVVWDRPRLRALCPGGGVPFDAPQPQLGPEGSRFQWHEIEVRLSVPGAHNAVNAAGALTACALAGADPRRAAAALADFRGARRRLELLGASRAGALVYDDYSHNPTKVAAAIAGVRTLAPTRLVAVFQPHLYSRTRALAREFGAALAGADSIVVLPIYPARENAADFPGVDGYLVAVAAADAAVGRPVAWMPGFDQARALLDAVLRDGDVCLVMGAGDIDSLARSLVV